MPSQGSAASRLAGVDVLRGLSIVAVVLLHIKIRVSWFAHIPVAPSLPRWLNHLIFANGDNGVTVFFAVSGFLITRTSLRRFGSLEELQPRWFYRIRFARIAPLLLLLLAVLSVLHLLAVPECHIKPEQTTLSRALLAALTFHLNWLEAQRGYLPPAWDVLWSLSVEELFYLLFPIVCLLLLRQRWSRPAFAWLLLALIAAGPFARSTWTTNEIWQEKSYLGGMDGIALGCLTALLVEQLSRRTKPIAVRWWFALGASGAMSMLFIAVWPRWEPIRPFMRFIGEHGLDGTVLSLGTCLVIAASVLLGGRGRSWTEPLRWFGRHSYEVYLTHELVVLAGTALYVRYQRGPFALWCLGILLVTALFGALVAKCFSEPLNRLLRPASTWRDSM